MRVFSARIIFGLLCAGWLSVGGASWAQPDQAKSLVAASVALSRESIFIGEKVAYKVNISYPCGTEVDIAGLEKNLQGITILDSRRSERTFFNKTRVTLAYVVTSYSVGAHKIAAPEIQYRQGSRSAWNKLVLADTILEVKSSLDSKGEIQGIGALKPVLDAPSRWRWPLIIAGLAILAAGLFIGKRYRAAHPAVRAPQVKAAHEIAYAQLQALKQRNLIQQGLVKEYFSIISDIVRHYLENRFSIRAPEMTTEEFLVYAQASALLGSDHKNLLKHFLNSCDMVKFAKYAPAAAEIEDVFAAAIRLIDQTKLEALAA